MIDAPGLLSPLSLQEHNCHHPAQSSENQDIVLSVKNVSKRFCRDLKRSLLYGVKDIAGEVFGAKRNDVTLRTGEFWALNDVSFELRRGEALGLVGANGAGKTTLLRIISGLIKPDQGSVEVQGRVAPLIALGAGFNPVLTGRENIYVNMSILGLSKAEIDDRFDAVVNFAEIGEAIDAPVQTYSSGMAARLGFASAIFTHPDILLIDEVLAVGDIQFRAKCYRKLAQLRKRGVSFILVSHNPIAIVSICDLAIYLNHGTVKSIDQVDKVLSIYENDVNIASSLASLSCKGKILLQDNEDHPDLQILEVGFHDSAGEILDPLLTGEPATFFIVSKVKRLFEDLKLSIIVKDLSREGSRVLFLDSSKKLELKQVSPGMLKIQIALEYCALPPGIFSMKIFFHCDTFHVLDSLESFVFLVKATIDITQCSFYQPSHWSFNTVN